jgi:hypothetical protein
MTTTHHPSLDELATASHRSASWWASVARALDRLDERLDQERPLEARGDGPLVTPAHGAEQASDDTRRRHEDHARLVERARRLRRRVAEVAGDRHQAEAVAGELSLLSVARDRYRHRTASLMGETRATPVGAQ